MKKHSQIILSNINTKLPTPSATARKFFEDAQNTFEICLSEYNNKDCERFRPLLLPFEETHNVKFLRMTRRPLGIYFEADDNIYYIYITEKDYQYRKIPRSEYEKTTRNLAKKSKPNK